MLINIGVLLSRLLVGGVFLIAGFAKLKAPADRFISAVLGYQLLPKPIAIVLARTLPWIEVVAGGLLIVGLWSRFAVVLSTALFLTFSFAMAISLLRGRDQACGCFQALTPVQWRLVYRNLGLMGLLLPVYAMNGGAWAADPWLAPQSDGHSGFSSELTVLVTVWLFTLSATLLLRHLTQRKQSSIKSVSITSQ